MNIEDYKETFQKSYWKEFTEWAFEEYPQFESWKHAIDFHTYRQLEDFDPTDKIIEEILDGDRGLPLDYDGAWDASCEIEKQWNDDKTYEKMKEAILEILEIAEQQHQEMEETYRVLEYNLKRIN